MSKQPSNSGKPWSSAAQAELQELAAKNTPTRVIALKTGRSPAAVSSQASKQSVSLKPVNQSPYGTKKR
jgi:hypothetical protein